MLWRELKINNSNTLLCTLNYGQNTTAAVLNVSLMFITLYIRYTVINTLSRCTIVNSTFQPRYLKFEKDHNNNLLKLKKIQNLYL